MRTARRFLRRLGSHRRGLPSEWKTYTLHMSIGWWATVVLVDGAGERTQMKLLVEPEEIGPLLRVLERNGIEEGRPTKVEWGSGQTAAQAAKSAKEVQG